MDACRNLFCQKAVRQNRPGEKAHGAAVKMYVKNFLKLCLLIPAILFFDCSDIGLSSDNHPPVIQTVTASPSMININQCTSLTCEATDSDADSLSYLWSSQHGIMTDDRSSTASWIAPDSSGLYTCKITVSDGKDVAADSIAIEVVNPLTESVDYRSWARGYWRAVRADTEISSGCGLFGYNWYAIETNTGSDSVIVVWDDGLACTHTPGTMYGNRITIEDCGVTALFEIQSDCKATSTFQAEDKTYSKTLKKERNDPTVRCF